MITIRPLIPADVPRLRRMWQGDWGDELFVVHGVAYCPDALSGFIAFDDRECVGEVTYTMSDGDCEIVSLGSLREGQRLGTRLSSVVVEQARQQSCRRVFLNTTNDNLNALGFYQKRGLELVRIHRGVVNEARKIKPSIPLIAMNNISLRDEIELEILLSA